MYRLLVFVGLAAIANGQTRYTFTANSVDVTGTCEWTTTTGAPINAWDRLVGVGYVCKTLAVPKYAGGVSTTSDGRCQYYCSTSAVRTPITVYGIVVYNQNEYTPKSLSNPYTLAPPPGCVPVSFKCDDTIDSLTPINNLSIALYGSSVLKSCALDNVGCAPSTNPSVECAACNMMRAIQTNVYPAESTVLTLRGTPYACLLTYLGIGSVEKGDKCFVQLGGHCTAFQGKVPFCFNNNRKTNGITNYGTNSGPPTMWCYYTNWGQYRDSPYKLTPTSPPPNLKNCDGVIYAFATIKVADSTVAPGYTPGAYVVTEFEWNDNVQMPATVAAGKTVLLSIGGWELGTGPWIKAAESPASRAIFVKSAIDLMKRYGFDGIDIDWEAPNFRGGTPVDIVNYGELAKLFRSELDKIGTYYFTTAVMVGHPINENFNMGVNHVHFDKIFLMTYDLFGGWDPAKRLCQTAWDIGTKCGLNGVSCPDPVDYFYLKYAVDFYVNLVPAEKLGFGLAFYGRSWQRTAGGPWETMNKKYSPQLKEVGVLGIAEIQNLYKLPCKIDAAQMCCMDTFTQGADEIFVGWDNYETMVMKINAVYETFGIKTFFSWAYDYDTLPEAPVHNRVINYVHTLGGAAPQAVDFFPTYQIGTGPLVRCAGIQAVVNDVIFSGVSYKEFYSVAGFSGIVVAPYKEVTSCTPGAPTKTIPTSPTPPGAGVDINTFLPSNDPNKFLIGLAGDGSLIQYAPVVQDVCQAVNVDTFKAINYVQVNNDFYFTKPQMRDGFVLLPLGVHHLMSNYTFAVDYINFDMVCSNLKIDSLPGCISTACGGRPDCIASYSAICSSAAGLLTNAHRSNKLMLDAFAELEAENQKAMMYEFVSENGLLAAPPQTAGGQIVEWIALGVAVASLATSGAALGIAIKAEKAVSALAAQQDATKDQVVLLGNQLVTISQKLDRNTQAVNQRLSDLQEQLNARFQTVNDNFATLSAGQQALAAQSNDRFSVTLGYISWAQQITGLTDQLTQGAIQMKHKVVMTKLCMMSLTKGDMANCPSDLAVYKQHPGLRNVGTVQALRFFNKKLLIVNYLPQTFSAFSPATAFPLPVMKDDGVCWPDYALTWVAGATYEPIKCTGRYCQNLTVSDEWKMCQSNYTFCKFVCGDCYRGMCYDRTTKEITYTKEGAIEARFKVTALPVFVTPVAGFDVSAIIDKLDKISFGNVTIVREVNTSVALESIQTDIVGIQAGLAEYQALYGALSLGNIIAPNTLMIVLVVSIILLALLVLGLILKSVCHSLGTTSRGGYERLEPDEA